MARFCQRCKTEIPAERVEVLPDTRLCVKCSAAVGGEFEVSVVGDLRGTGIWTLTPTEEGVHVRFDWRVHADRSFLRVLTPVLRPLFRWNHNVAIKQAMAGLESYARAHTQSVASPS